MHQLHNPSWAFAFASAFGPHAPPCTLTTSSWTRKVLNPLQSSEPNVFQRQQRCRLSKIQASAGDNQDTDDADEPVVKGFAAGNPKFKPRGVSLQNQLDESGYLRPEYSNESTLPEIVSQRMGRRVIVLFGVPFFAGIGVFALFYYLSTQKEITFIPSVVASSTLGVFALGLAGITYGIMSASWDPEIEGSVLGLEEFKSNVFRTVEALGRQKMRETSAEKLMDVDELQPKKKKSKKDK